jgi:hypothetical protein
MESLTYDLQIVGQTKRIHYRQAETPPNEERRLSRPIIL